MSDSLSSLTAVVVDLNPLAWGLRTVIESNNAQQQDKSNARAETIVQGLDAILTFINSFLLMTHGNQVAVIGVHPFGSGTFKSKLIKVHFVSYLQVFETPIF